MRFLPTHVAPWVSAHGFRENVAKGLMYDLASIPLHDRGEGKEEAKGSF